MATAELRRDAARRRRKDKELHAKKLDEQNKAMRERLLKVRTPGSKEALVAEGKLISPRTVGPDIRCSTRHCHAF